MSARYVAYRQAETSAALHRLTEERTAPRFPSFFAASSECKWHKYVADKYEFYGQSLRACETSTEAKPLIADLDTFASNVAECGGRGLYYNPEDLSKK